MAHGIGRTKGGRNTKLHAICDEKGRPCVLLLTPGNVHDCKVAQLCIAAMPASAELVADKGYDSQALREWLVERGTEPVIPPRKNAKPLKAVTAGAVARNDALRASKYLGRALRRRWSGYHRQSRVKTRMHCVKLPGQRLIARDFERQVAEFQVRVAVLNSFTALGIPVTEAMG